MKIPVFSAFEELKSEKARLLLELSNAIVKEEKAERRGFWQGVLACVGTLAFFYALAFITGWIWG